MARIIGIGNQKGGVAKSTLIHLFSLTLSENPINKSVLVLDATPNRSLAFLSQLESNKHYHVIGCAPSEIPECISKYADQVDLIFLDLPSNFEQVGVKSAWLCCDTILVPSRAGLTDQVATKLFLSEIEEIQKVRSAAGYETDLFLIPSLYLQEEHKTALQKQWENAKLPYFESGYPMQTDLQYFSEHFQPVMDYVTEGAEWTEYQHAFHGVFIEFYNYLEAKTTT